MLALLITLAYFGLPYIRPQEIVPVLPIVLGLAVLAWIPRPGKRFTAPQNWLCVAIDQCTRFRWPAVAPLSFRKLVLPIAAFEFASILGMYAFVKILL